MSGLCGVVSRNECSEILLFGTDYHSHLGSQRAGMAVYGPDGFKKKIHDISQAQFKSKFGEIYQELHGSFGIGVISDTDPQPLLIHSRFGQYAIAMAGRIENKEELAKALFVRGSVFTETTGRGVNQIELLAKLIETGENFVAGIKSIYSLIEGSASILLLTKEGVYAARDGLGRTPLVLGENENGEYMVCTESSAFANLGFRTVKELEPGEIVLISEKGFKTLVEPGTRKKICAFLWIYTGYPASSYEGINVQCVRENCGRCLAKRDNVKPDIVSGVPDSGLGHAVGYAIESKVPYRPVLAKYTPGYGRSYIPPNQAIRDHVAKMKLIPIPDVIKGNRIVLCEDSIVRGTQLKNYTVSKLVNAGVKEIHLRSACPPLLFTCKYDASTRDLEELIARRAIRSLEGGLDAKLDKYIDLSSPEHARMVEWIRAHLGITTLRYQLLDDMIEAIGLPREQLCLHCWTGEESGYQNDIRQLQLNLL